MSATRTGTKTLLSVDWDFFFPNPFDGARMPGENLLLWDWNKRESPFHIETIWTSRAAGFLANGLPLPQLHPSHTIFARRFRFSPHTKLYLAESHSQAVRPEIRLGVNRVMSFDAHHDCGYGSVAPVLGSHRGTIKRLTSSSRVSRSRLSTWELTPASGRWRAPKSTPSVSNK